MTATPRAYAGASKPDHSRTEPDAEEAHHSSTTVGTTRRNEVDTAGPQPERASLGHHWRHHFADSLIRTRPAHRAV